MAVSFPGPVPVPHGAPRPMEPMYGNIYSDLGGAARQTAADLEGFERQLGAEETRAAKIQDMVERRKQAMRVAAARAELKEKDQALKEDEIAQKQATADAKQKDADRKYELEKKKEENRQAYRLKALEARKAAAAGKKKKADARKDRANLKGYTQTTQRELSKIQENPSLEDEVRSQNSDRINRLSNDIQTFQKYLDSMGDGSTSEEYAEMVEMGATQEQLDRMANVQNSPQYIKIKKAIAPLEKELKERMELDSVLGSGEWKGVTEGQYDDLGATEPAGRAEPGIGGPAEVDEAILWLEDNPNAPQSEAIRAWLTSHGYL